MQIDLIMNFLLLAATTGAAIYCHVLAKRLRKFTTLETGMGGAIAVLSTEVDGMAKALVEARQVASGSEARLKELTGQADQLARRLELLIASLHDLPDESPAEPARRQETSPKAHPEPPAAKPRRQARFVRRRANRNPLEAAQ